MGADTSHLRAAWLLRLALLLAGAAGVLPAPSLEEAANDLALKPQAADGPPQPAEPHRRRHAEWLHYEADRANPFHAVVSKDSWTAYLHFKEETCRHLDDEHIAERVVNNTENGYFKWEENVFHRELRKIILPETRDGSFSALIGTPLLTSLDPRIFSTAPESLCKVQPRDSEEEARAKDEQDRFEDYLINKMLPITSDSGWFSASKATPVAVAAVVGNLSATPVAAATQQSPPQRNASRHQR